MPFPRSIALLVALIVSPLAQAQTDSHALRFQQFLARYIQAQECQEPPHLCRSLRQRVESASCDPPFIRLSFVPKQPIVVQGRITVGEDGVVKQVEITQPSPVKALNEAIPESLSECRLGVVKQDGVAIGSSFLVEWSMLHNTTRISVMPIAAAPRTPPAPQTPPSSEGERKTERP